MQATCELPIPTSAAPAVDPGPDCVIFVRDDLARPGAGPADRLMTYTAGLPILMLDDGPAADQVAAELRAAGWNPLRCEIAG